MTAPALTPDRPALIRLATATRPDIDPRDLEGALIALEAAGWTWNRILVQTTLMLAHGEEPRDLREAARDPLGLKKDTRR